MKMTGKKTQATFSSQMKEKHPTIQVKGEYVDRDTFIPCFCKVCKTDFERQPKSMVTYRNKGCPNCAKNRMTENKRKTDITRKKDTADKKVSEFKLRFPKFKLLQVPINRHQKVSIVCDKGHTFNNSVGWTLNTLYGCPHCAAVIGGENHKIPIEELKKDVEVSTNGEVILLKEIGKTVPRKGRFECSVCKNKWTTDIDIVRHSPEGYTGCKRCTIEKLYKATKIVEIQGRTFEVQGYEDRALLELSKKYKVDKIVAGSGSAIPVIPYSHGNKDRKYYPDIHIPHRNLLLEVKSTYTLGLFKGSKGLYSKTKAKAKATIASGYKFKLLLYGNTQGIKLPKDWISKTKMELMRELKLL